MCNIWLNNLVDFSLSLGGKSLYIFNTRSSWFYNCKQLGQLYFKSENWREKYPLFEANSGIEQCVHITAVCFSLISELI